MEASTTTRQRTATPVARVWNMAKKLDYTMDEINAMIDQSERDIVEGRVYDFDEAMDELEKEFAEEDHAFETVEAI